MSSSFVHNGVSLSYVEPVYSKICSDHFAYFSHGETLRKEEKTIFLKIKIIWLVLAHRHATAECQRAAACAHDGARHLRLLGQTSSPGHKRLGTKQSNVKHIYPHVHIGAQVIYVVAIVGKVHVVYIETVGVLHRSTRSPPQEIPCIL